MQIFKLFAVPKHSNILLVSIKHRLRYCDDSLEVGASTLPHWV